MRLIILFMVLLFSSSSFAATYYVRTDGGLYGSTSTTCNGLTDAAFTGANGPDCAVSHMFEMTGVNAAGDYPQRMVGGDTIIVKSGSYRTGRIDGVYDNNGCSSGWPWDCYNASIPSGTAETPTRILGEGWDTGCANPPELYGVEKAKYLLYMQDSAYVEIACLELTDHAACSTNSNLPAELQCPSDAPFGDYSQHGIYAYNVNGLSIDNLNIHGMQGAGMKAAEITDFSMTNTNIEYNSSGGMNLEIDGVEEDNQFYNTFLMRDSSVSWSGCIEDYPTVGTIVDESCIGGNAGGFGDGVAFTYQSSGVQVEVDNCSFVGNVEDGFDALYFRVDPTSVISVHNSFFMHNAGNDLKVGGSAIVENNILVGDCNYFFGTDMTDDGDPETAADDHVTHCRGNATLSITAQENDTSVTVINNSFGGQADSMISYSARNNSVVECDGSERFNVYNNIFRGGTHFQYDISAKIVDSIYINYLENWVCVPEGFVEDYSNNVFYNSKQGASDCTESTDSICDEDPLYTTFDEASDSYDFKVATGSPAIVKGLAPGTAVGENDAATTIPTLDYYGAVRDVSTPDIGMHEYDGITATCTTTPSLCDNQGDCETATWDWCVHTDICSDGGTCDEPAGTFTGSTFIGTGSTFIGTGTIGVQ